ncbi:G-protein coupled receptor Mth2 [Holothuria leucospilota]|uniref:G-protein coupled receptor Mth2 n=1 Tax=Holothuria leucospilota TaxID=206669 RepID=A0A9Q1BS09_HOLLE|nr:G-protein coupled receptor Mth2 [Holothuria leucospilota]
MMFAFRVITSFCCLFMLIGRFRTVSCRGTEVLNTPDCVGRCGQGSNQTSCACDNKCKIYDDCCIDFDDQCPNESISSCYVNRTQQNGDYDRYSSCLPLAGNSSVSDGFPTKYMMVSSCPNTWNNGLIRERCIANDSSDFFNFLPVHDGNGVLFKNSYCALCHGTSVDEMLPWKIGRNGTSYKALPARNIWGSKYEICEEKFYFYKTCPYKTNYTLTEQCETLMEPIRFQNGLGIKNEKCMICNNIRLQPDPIAFEPNVVTFDVLFGVQSWSALTSNCRNNHNLDLQEIFQNACRLLNDLREMGETNPAVDNPAITMDDPTECVLNFLSKVFQTSQDFYSVHYKSLPGDDKPYVNIYLPNDLSALYLQNIVKNNITTPKCNVTLGINIQSEYLNVSGCITVEKFTVELDNQSFHVVDVDCISSACILSHHCQITCPDVTCQWENEELSPIDFTIEDFVTMEITHINTGARLEFQEYTVSRTGSIKTCTEFLIGPWINVSYYIQLLCGSLSLICILFIITIHALFPKLRNIYGFCLVSLLSMLWVALFLLSISTLTQMVDGLAQFVSFLGHYAWLSTFAWMTVISFHVSHTFSGNFVANKMSKISSRTDFIFFSLFGWGLPLPFVITSVILHLCHCTNFQYTRHWMSRSIAAYIVFAVPAGLLALTSTCLFVLGMTKLRQRQAKPTDSENKHIAMMHNYLVALRLFFIVGVPWILLIVYIAYRNRVLLPILTFVNSLQGFFIFLSFVSTKRVRSLVRDRLGQSRQTTTAYSRAKPTAQTDTGTPENTPKTKRQRRSASSASGEEPKYQPA